MTEALSLRDMEAVAEQLRRENATLPCGISIWLDRRTNNIVVANDQLGFCVTERAVRDGLHSTQFAPALAGLIGQIESRNPSASGIIRPRADL